MKKYLSILIILCTVGIHAQELLPYPLDTINGEEFYRYEIERSIGLYRISVNFGVPQSEIIRYNPQIQEYGIRYGETLSIPTKRPVVQQTEAVVVSTTVTETVEPTEVTVSDERLEVNNEGTEVVELAMMLPFESKQTKRSANADRMMEFYQGALLALQELQNDSTLYRLRVYDTERSERRVNALCESTELDSTQGIIGLVYPIQIERMAQWCDLHQVPLLLPFSDDIDLATHPQVLQFNSADVQEADSLCQWFKSQDSIHCVMIEVKETDIVGSVRTLRKHIKLNGIAYTGMALRDVLNDSAAYALDKEKENIIILHSDRYQHVRILMPHLLKLQQAGYSIRIVSQYAWIQEEIGLPQVYTSVFTENTALEAFDTNRNLYFANTHVGDTPRYDLLGHDLMKALVEWLKGKKETEGLQSLIRWQQKENGGYQNANVKVCTKD